MIVRSVGILTKDFPVKVDILIKVYQDSRYGLTKDCPDRSRIPIRDYLDDRRM